MRLSLFAAAAALSTAPALADTILANNEGIVRNALCVGADCVDPEVYNAGEAIVRMKAVYTRLQFVDDSDPTSNYATDDWQLRANEDNLYGHNLFAIENLSTGARPLTIRGEAASHSLFISADEDVGLGTSLPQTKLHLVDTNSPTIRFEQTASGGFPQQTWDLLANHGNVYLRDLNLDTIPFAVFKNAPSNSLRVTQEGNIGNGTASVDAPLHIFRSDGTARIKVEETSQTAQVREMMEMRNNGGSYFTLTNTNTGRSWYFAHEHNPQGRFMLSHSDGGLQMSLTPGGDMRILGRYYAGGTQLNVPDYVFGADYALRPLSEVKAFIAENSHLPEVPSAAQIKAEGLDMTEMQLTLLKKIEELTLYTLEQDDVIVSQNAAIASLEDRLAELETQLRAKTGTD